MMRGLILLFLFSATALQAQTWPARPVTIVVGFAPGGNIDGVARSIAPALSETLGQPVLIENRPGAGGNIGPALAAKANPAGYTPLLMPKRHTASASLNKKGP